MSQVKERSLGVKGLMGNWFKRDMFSYVVFYFSAYGSMSDICKNCVTYRTFLCLFCYKIIWTIYGWCPALLEMLGNSVNCAVYTFCDPASYWGFED